MYLIVTKISKSNYSLYSKDNSSLAFIENSVNQSFRKNYKNGGQIYINRFDTKTDYETLGNVFKIQGFFKTMKLNKICKNLN